MVARRGPGGGLEAGARRRLELAVPIALVGGEARRDGREAASYAAPDRRAGAPTASGAYVLCLLHGADATEVAALRAADLAEVARAPLPAWVAAGLEAGDAHARAALVLSLRRVDDDRESGAASEADLSPPAAQLPERLSLATIGSELDYGTDALDDDDDEEEEEEEVDVSSEVL